MLIPLPPSLPTLSLDPAIPSSWLCPITPHYVNGASVKMDLPRSIEPPGGSAPEHCAGSSQGSKRPQRGKETREHLVPHYTICPLHCSLAKIPAHPPSCVFWPPGLCPGCPLHLKYPPSKVADACSTFGFQLGCHLLQEAFPDYCPPGWSVSPFIDALSLCHKGPLNLRLCEDRGRIQTALSPAWV